MAEINYNTISRDLINAEDFDAKFKEFVDTYLNGVIDTNDEKIIYILKQWFEQMGQTVNNPLTNFLLYAKDKGLKFDFETLGSIHDKVATGIIDYKKDFDFDDENSIVNKLLLDRDFLTKSTTDSKYYIDIFQFLKNKSKLTQVFQNVRDEQLIPLGPYASDDISVGELRKNPDKVIPKLIDSIIFDPHNNGKLRDVRDVERMLGDISRRIRGVGTATEDDRERNLNRKDVNKYFGSNTRIQKFLQDIGLTRENIAALKNYLNSSDNIFEG